VSSKASLVIVFVVAAFASAPPAGLRRDHTPGDGDVVIE
jgi:hypothetical protein